MHQAAEKEMKEENKTRKREKGRETIKRKGKIERGTERKEEKGRAESEASMAPAGRAWAAICDCIR